jgi:transposase
MDNLDSHKGTGVRAAIRAAGARLFFLTPYSPDHSLIEQAFAKLKAHLRKLAREPWRPPATASAPSSTQQRRPSAPTTSSTPKMLQCKMNTL